MAKRLSFSAKQEILRLIQTGAKDADVAAQIGCGRQTVARIRQVGLVTDRTTKGKTYQVRVSAKEAEAFEAMLVERNMSASDALRRMIRLSEGVIDFQKEEVNALREATRQLVIMARNLTTILQLAHRGQFKWNARDAKLVGDLADRSETVARSTQVLHSAARRGAFVKSLGLSRGAENA
jgi:hypothetical protein